MDTENEIERDLFGEPIAPAPPVLVETLVRPALSETLGAFRLMARLSAALRGDSTAAGWTILLDGLPLAGLIDDPMRELLSGPLPGEDAINEAMNRHAAQLAPRWRAALAMLEGESAQSPQWTLADEGKP